MPLFPTRLAGLAALAAALSLVPACNKGSGRVKVAVVTNCTAEFWSIAEAGANKAAKEFDCDVVFRQPAEQTVSAQKQIVDDLIRTGVSGLAVSVVNPGEQTAALAAVSKKVSLITMDNDAPESGRKCYVGLDNYDAGKVVAEMIKKAMPQGGTLALFIGTTASANATARIGGVLDQLAGQKDAPRTRGAKIGNFVLDDIYTDDTNQATAQDNAKNVVEKLRNTPNVCHVGLYAYNPKAILNAAKSKGLVGKVTIVGFDEDDETLRGIEAGEIVGTVVQDPFNYGYKSVEILAALARGDASKVKDYSPPQRRVTKAGGPDETVAGFGVKNLKASDFLASLKADQASAK